MPLLTLVLQETFSRNELGVVTSSSQFFRSIGGTFGITILGVIMNHKSSTELNLKLTPILSGMGDQLAGIRDKAIAMIQTDPQGLYSMIFNPETVKLIPQKALADMVPVLKQTLVDSLHSVFQYGLGFIAAGAVLALFLGRITLKKRSKEENEQSGLHSVESV
jgi:hypothetical protein